MPHFKTKDFNDLLFPVHTLKLGMDIFSVFPKLKDYGEFQTQLSATIPFLKVFKYIVFAYDEKSPFFRQIEDLVERKKAAILEAGFKPNKNGGFSEHVKSILNCEDGRVNKMIIRYCRMQGKDFTNLIASQEAYYQMNQQLMTGIDKDDDALAVAKSKAQLDELVGKVNERLNEKARSFLSQEVAQGLHEELWSMAEDESANVTITPEDYADEV